MRTTNDRRERVTIDESEQDEKGIRLFVGQTTIITVWDAQSAEREREIAWELKAALEEDAK